MHKAQVALFAVVTFVSACLLFASVMPVFNRIKDTGDLVRAYQFLFIPFAVQIVWFIAGAVYSARRNHREVVIGILCGFGLEVVALVVMIAISATAHF